MFKSLGPLEIFLILLIVLVIFGAGRLSEIGSGMGKAFRGFKDAISGKEDKPAAEKPDGAMATSAPAAPAAPSDTKKSA